MLMDMVKAENSKIVVARPASAEETAREEALRGRSMSSPFLIEEVVGVVQGLQALRPQNNLRDVVTYTLGDGFKFVEKIDIDTARDFDLRRAKKWIDEFDENVRRAKQIFGEARRFLTKRNLSQLEKASLPKCDVEDLRRAISHLPDDLPPPSVEKAA
jgi:hypothetical protein